VVEWPHDQSKSPLGKEVDANNDVIIIAGNMSSDSEASPGICVRTELQKPDQVLTRDDGAYISDGGVQSARQMILNVQYSDRHLQVRCDVPVSQNPYFLQIE
jgi:hypothetical protein